MSEKLRVLAPEQVQRRTVLVLALAQLFSGVGAGVGVSLGTLMAAELSGQQQLAGTSALAMTLAGALSALPLAALAARAGRRPALMTGFVLAGLGALSMMAAPVSGSFALVLLGSALLGVGTAANLQARFAAVDLAVAEHRGRDLSFVVWSITLGAVAGPNLITPGAGLGAAVGLPELSGPFLFSLAAMAVGVVLLWAALRPDPLIVARRLATEASDADGGGTPAASHVPAAPSSAPRSKRSLRAGLRAARHSPAALLGLGTLAAAHLVMVAVMSMTPVHLQALDQAGGHRHSEVDTLAIIGFTISLHIAGMYALSPVMGWLADRLGRIPVIICAQLVFFAAAAAAGWGQQEQPLVAVGLVLLGLGWSAATIAGSTLLVESVAQSERVMVQGVADAVMGAAGAAGAALSGVLLVMVGYPGLNLAAAAVAAVVLLVALGVRRGSSVPAHAE